MKIKNIRISWLQSIADWSEESDDEDSKFLGIKGLKYDAYGESEEGTIASVKIQSTPEEYAEFMSLIRRVEERINKEGE